MTTAIINGHTYTDDNNVTTGLGNGGHRTRFIPLLADIATVAQQTANDISGISINADIVQTESINTAASAAATASDLASAQAAVAGIDIGSKEPGLGNPASSDLLLTSTAGGDRSWAGVDAVGALLGSITAGSLVSALTLTGLNLPLDETKKYLLRYKIIAGGSTVSYLNPTVNTSKVGVSHGLYGNIASNTLYHATLMYATQITMDIGVPVYTDTILCYMGKNWVFKTLAVGSNQMAFSSIMAISTILVAITSLGLDCGFNGINTGSKLELFEYNGVLN